MSIPLDRLYHYIESVAQDVCKDTIIYRFFPHGSKNIANLNPTRNQDVLKFLTGPQIFCNDQEPLNFTLYQHYGECLAPKEEQDNTTKDYFNLNLRKNIFNIFDQCILLHSEKNSPEIPKYINKGFIPAYHWSHALIARDWFRYAKHIHVSKDSIKHDFLIYNRAWSGSREYRLKFAELVVNNNLVDQCNTSVGFHDQSVHYSNHVFKNPIWKPTINLELHFNDNASTPCYSADFTIEDYESSHCEVVLETLFDTTQLQLTEKVLRPIAIGQPFLLCAPATSLQYLRSYGFKTFDSVFDESYDLIENPLERLQAIVSVMKEISSWDEVTKTNNFNKLKEITEFNKKHFFSDDFLNSITSELKDNLSQAITQLIQSNTYNRCIALNQYNHSKYLTYQNQNAPIDYNEAIKTAYCTALNLKQLLNK